MVSAGRDAILSRYDVSRETSEQLDRYEALLRGWQRTTNLVASSAVDDLWERHFADGLALARLVPECDRVVDLGSGGGIPGINLAMALKERERGRVAMVESVGRKAAFLRSVVRELDLPATVHADRIERSGTIVGAADVVTARALAPLDRLFEWVAPALRPGAIALFAKGRNHDEEIDAASAQWQFDMVKHPSPNAADSVVLEIRNIVRIA